MLHGSIPPFVRRSSPSGQVQAATEIGDRSLSQLEL